MFTVCMVVPFISVTEIVGKNLTLEQLRDEIEKLHKENENQARGLDDVIT